MKKKKKSVPTIWEVPDELWKRMAPLILEMDLPKDTGRSRANPRNVMDAIIFRIRTGCQWNYRTVIVEDNHLDIGCIISWTKVSHSRELESILPYRQQDELVCSFSCFFRLFP